MPNILNPEWEAELPGLVRLVPCHGDAVTSGAAAALRAAEMSCDALLKATQVDGVYDADPKKVPNAKRYDSLSYHQVLAQNLQVMDAAAISLSRENRIPILVFSLGEPGGLVKVLRGEGRATIIEEK